MTMVYTPLKPQVSERQIVIEWLKAHGYPALPVAPAQDAFRYPKRNKQGKIEYQKDGVTPKPLFIGKNPSYLDQNGIPHLVNHGQYQSCLPSDRELKEWFANPLNGVGTLGGWNNTIWLDLDLKQFADKEECDRAFWEILDAHQDLAQTYLEESHSGGWRIGVLVKQKPNFTNFALTPGGSHVGEALGEGRFTVLAPTIGPSGNSYKSINRAVPVEVMSLESIGIYPTSTKSQRQALVTPHPAVSYIPGSIPLEQLGNDTSREILQGSCPTGDRSEALTTALQEWYGWQNWARENGIAVSDTPEDLALYAGQQLGIDSDRVTRILKTIDPTSCHPAALHRGNEESCWKKIRRLDKATFETKCPAPVKDGIKAEWQRVNSALPSGIGFSDRDRSSAKSAQKLSLKEAVVKAREILAVESDELVANIKLEEIREACGMSEFGWERKIIKPLRRDLEGDRFKLELLGLLQIDDSVERIRQQALLAPKYQMSSSLIEKAMSAMKQRTQTPESKALDLDELFDLESEGLSWVIPGLLPEKETIVLAGAPKAGKTLLAIDVAYAVVTGESHFLSEAVKRGKVLLVSTDESPNSTKAKLLNRGFRRCDKDSIKMLPTWDITQMGTLETLLEDFRPDLVIIDSLRRINKGSEISENSAEFADNIYTLKETLERYGSAGILIHHSNKDREALGVHRLRGSSAIAGAVWGTWQLDQIPKPDPNNKKKLILDPKDPKRTLSVFARDTEGQQLLIEFNPENSSWAKQGEVGDSEEARAERDTLRERILKLLAIPAHTLGLSGSEIIERLDAGDVNKHSVYNCLNQMASKRLINCKPAPGDKRYNIYSLPQKNPTPESDFSHTPPSPTPTVVEDDYYAESYVYQGLENSHHNSHPPKENSHTPLVENPANDCSNQDLVSNSEIVTSLVNKEGGEGVVDQPVVKLGRGSATPDNAITANPWEEKYTATNVDADGWGEIVRGIDRFDSIAPTTNQASQDDTTVNVVEVADVTPCAPSLGEKPSIEVSGSTQQFQSDDLAGYMPDYKQLKAQTDAELKRLGWDKQQGREHLLKVYGVRSRQLLRNEQLRHFLNYLEAHPTPPENEPLIDLGVTEVSAATLESSPLPQKPNIEDTQQFQSGVRVRILTGNWKGNEAVVTKKVGNTYYAKREGKWEQGYFGREIELICTSEESQPPVGAVVDDEIEEEF